MNNAPTDRRATRVRSIVFCAALVTLGASSSLAPLAAQSATVIPADDPALQIRLVDTIVLANGNRLEGEIVDDGLTHLVFRQTDGIEGRFPQTEIREKVRRNLPEQVYALRVKEYFDPARAADQRALALWCLRGEVSLVGEAIDHLEEWSALAPDAEEPLERLLSLYRERRTDDVEESDRELVTVVRAVENGVGGNEVLLHAAERLVALGELRGAIDLLTPLADRNATEPAIAAGQDLLVDLLSRVGDRETARGFAQQFLADENRASGLPLLRHSARWLLEDVAAGVPGAARALEETLATILEENPSDGRALLWRGSLAMLQGDVEGARASLKRAFELGEFGAESLVTIALNLAREGEMQKALDTLRGARSVPEYEALVTAVEAYVQERLGDPEFAAALLRDAVEARGVSWQTWVQSIQGRARLDRDFAFDRAIDRAIESVGENPAAFAELSLLAGDRALAEGKVAEARRWLDYARSAGRVLPELSLRVALAHLAEGGDPRLARRALDDAIAAAPDDPDIRNAFGCLEYRSGDLARAREHFEEVLSAIPETDRSELAAGRRDYARRALELIDRTLREEVWSDDFERPDGPQVLNNWDKSENVGVIITLRAGKVRFEGQQQVDEELTKLTRVVKGNHEFARLRASFEIATSTRARIGLRIAKLDGGGEGTGLVVFRDLDGTIAVASISREGAEVIRSDGDGASLEFEHVLVPTRWPTDGKPHVLELRLPRDDVDDPGASVYLDGTLVMSGIPVPRLSGRGTTIVGVSGQAAEGTPVRFSVDDFELFRRMPQVERGAAPR